NGVERCSPEAGCVPGAPPDCSDGNGCTLDLCDPLVGCRNEMRDDDGDGAAPLRCGGLGCDDTAAASGPNAREVCDNDVDDDCDGAADLGDAACRAAFRLGACESPEIPIVTESGIHRAFGIPILHDDPTVTLSDPDPLGSGPHAPGCGSHVW